MNEEAVQVLKEAMESPDWWTNRARLTAREIVRRLEERGYTVAPEALVRSVPRAAAEWEGNASSVATAPAREPASEHTAENGALAVASDTQHPSAKGTAPSADGANGSAPDGMSDQAMLAALMADLESSVAAARGAREAANGSGAPDQDIAPDGKQPIDGDSPLADEQRESA